MFSVYTLSDPRTDQVRYVGISNDVERRYVQHINENINASKRDWIQELKSNQLMPSLTVIETELTLEEAKEHERGWIRHYLEHGSSLVNISGVTKPWVGGIRIGKQVKEQREKRIPEGPPPPFLMLAKEVAGQLGVTVNTLEKWLRNQKMPAYYIQKRWMVMSNDLEEFIEKNPKYKPEERK